MPHKLKEGKGVFNYKGCLVEKIIGGYRLFGQTCTTEEEVETIILNACSSLNESIVTVENRNDGAINCQNE